MVISDNNKNIIYSLLVYPFPVTGIPILVYILPFYASNYNLCLLYTSPSPRDKRQARMPSSA